MKITKLSWAGLMIEAGDMTLYIDPLENVAEMAPFIGEPKFPLLEVPNASSKKVAALITHIHADHFDPPLLRRLVGESGVIFAPDSVRIAGMHAGLSVKTVKAFETLHFPEFTITPLPAVDWIGDEQVSFIISDGQKTILHGGDTNWHGYWWPISRKFGTIDAAFLPVNGVVGGVPGVNPFVSMNGTMTPQQAVSAAHILGARFLVPMHYGLFNNPPAYAEFPDLEEVLTESALQLGVKLRRLADGEVLKI